MGDHLSEISMFDYQSACSDWLLLKGEWGPLHGWLGIRIMCPSGATCLSADCCFSNLAL